jgi:broad specificity phosphatase PhoE
MTVFYLVRHAANDLAERVLCGRKLDVPLNAHGRRQAEALARRLAHEPIAQVISSPRRRARQTAEPIAAALDLSIDIAAQLDEHDAGIWSGQSFADLARDPRWRLWNERRHEVRPPEGESMAELQKRILRYLDRLAASFPNDTIVLVTHAEPIRAALLHERGLPLKDFWCVDVPLACATTIVREPAPLSAVPA